MLPRLSALLRRDLAIDLGTAATRVAMPGQGIVVDEPSVVAVPRAGNRMISSRGAVGHLARQMLGRAPDSVSVVRPLRAGVIADVQLCEAMLRYFLNKARLSRYGLRPRVLITASGGLTPVERQAIYRSAHRAGAGQVMLLGTAQAAALGVGLPIAEPVAGMIVDLGAGATEVAVFSLGEVVAQRTIRVGGDCLDRAIVDWLRRKHSLRVGLSAAEQLRTELGSAWPTGDERTDEVRGVDVATGLPKRVTLDTAELRQALADPLEAILDCFRTALDQCSPELVSDLIDRGVVLCGGGALLRGLDRWLEERTGIAARVSPDALTAVAQGALVCLEHLDAWSSLVESGDGAI